MCSCAATFLCPFHEAKARVSRALVKAPRLPLRVDRFLADKLRALLDEKGKPALVAAGWQEWEVDRVKMQLTEAMPGKGLL